MNGKGDRPRGVNKSKYDVKYDLAFSKTNPYTRGELDSFIKKGWITEKEAFIFVERSLVEMVRLNQEMGLY
jgi:hypothetical protein